MTAVRYIILTSNDISLLPEYVEEILHLHVIPMRHQVGCNFILMQNARLHTARIVLKVPRRKQHRGAITSIDERRYLNPIEHVWDMMGRRICNLERLLTNLQEAALHRI